MQEGLTIFVLSYNSLKYIDRCVDSFVSAVYPVPYRVVVVDNASSDGSFAHLAEKYSSDPRVCVIGFNTNYGYGPGFMKALERFNPKTKYIAFSNADLTVEPDWFQPIMEAFRVGGVAAVGPVVCRYYDHDVIQGAGKVLRNRWVLTMGGDYAKYEDYRVFRRRHPLAFNVFYPDGALVVFDTEAFRRIGGYDESFFMYREQLDLGLRIWLSGFKALTAPASRVYHVGGGSSENINSPYLIHRNYFLSHKNIIRALVKDLPLGVLPIAGAIVAFRLLLYAFIRSVRSRDPFVVFSSIMAMVTGLRMLRDTFQQRTKFLPLVSQRFDVLECVTTDRLLH